VDKTKIEARPHAAIAIDSTTSFIQ